MNWSDDHLRNKIDEQWGILFNKLEEAVNIFSVVGGDEIDKEIILLEVDEEYENYNSLFKDEDCFIYPQWWQVSYGIIESSPENIKEACIIRDEFFRFQDIIDEPLSEKFKSFEKYKASGKVFPHPPKIGEF